MARLTHTERLRHCRTVLGFWEYHCYIHAKRSVAEWIRKELEGYTFDELKRLMYEHENGGGEVDEVRETRPEWRDEAEFHHDMRLGLPGGRRIYIETVLVMALDPEDSEIVIVNMHDA
jgi:hypothetical protein